MKNKQVTNEYRSEIDSNSWKLWVWHCFRPKACTSWVKKKKAVIEDEEGTFVSNESRGAWSLLFKKGRRTSWRSPRDYDFFLTATKERTSLLSPPSLCLYSDIK
jgi:hypothetical protein